MAISETKGQGWRAIPTKYRKASDILTSTLVALLFSSHPKRERDREAHVNYYASADNRERQPSHHKTKLNNNNTNQHSSLTKKIHRMQNEHKTKATFSCLLRHPAWKRSGTILKKKIQKWIRKENISKKKRKQVTRSKRKQVIRETHI